MNLAKLPSSSSSETGKSVTNTSGSSLKWATMKPLPPSSHLPGSLVPSEKSLTGAFPSTYQATPHAHTHTHTKRGPSLMLANPSFLFAWPTPQFSLTDPSYLLARPLTSFGQAPHFCWPDPSLPLANPHFSIGQTPHFYWPTPSLLLGRTLTSILARCLISICQTSFLWACRRGPTHMQAPQKRSEEVDQQK